MTATKLTAATITDDQIRALRDEARQAGDLSMAHICGTALIEDADGPTASRAACAKAINDARAMDDTE